METTALFTALAATMVHAICTHRQHSDKRMIWDIHASADFFSVPVAASDSRGVVNGLTGSVRHEARGLDLICLFNFSGAAGRCIQKTRPPRRRQTRRRRDARMNPAERRRSTAAARVVGEQVAALWAREAGIVVVWDRARARAQAVTAHAVRGRRRTGREGSAAPARRRGRGPSPR